MISRVCLCMALVLLGGCLAKVQLEREITEADDWLQVVMEHRELVRKQPRDGRARMQLEKVEKAAADHYYSEGSLLLEDGKVDEAIVEFRNGLVAQPGGEPLTRALALATARRDARFRYDQARAMIELGRWAEAQVHLEQALDIYPLYEEAQRGLVELEEKRARRDAARSIIASAERITLNFSETDVRDAFQYLADAYSLNIVFDGEVKSAPVSLYADKVTLRQALDLLLRASKTQYKQVGTNTLIIAPDTLEKRALYQDRLLRTFSLNSIKAKEMTDILKANLKVDNIVVNEHMNTVTIREAEDVLLLAEKLVIGSDQPKGEVILDVEILEVDRTKSEQLGLNLGEQVTLSYPQFTTSDSVRNDVLKKGVVTVPTITFNYLKKDVDATILASPALRVLDNQEAKLHIGERVPLRSSTILDATGQTRTTFEYRDVGIKLEVLPDIHVDGSVSANVRVEVSALGANVGTPDEPALSILTRHVETAMLLRDGETAIIGGLIQDTGGNNRIRPVGLGEIPVLGRLFSNSLDEKRRTDVMLTITPRVVRPQALPPQSVREFYSGNAERFATEPMFSYIGSGATVKVGPQQGASQSVAPAVASAAVVTTPGTARPALRFDNAKYQIGKDQRATVTLVADQFPAVQSLPLQIMFNPGLLSFVQAESIAGGNLAVVAEQGENPGMVLLTITGTPGQASGPLVLLELEGRAEGISYLMTRPAMLTAGQGETQPLDSVMTRVLVK